MDGMKRHWMFLLIGVVTVICAVLFYVSQYGREGISPQVSQSISHAISEVPSARSQLAAVEGTGSGLIGWWKFDDGSGTSASDSSGNGNAITLSGATWVPGKVGDALSFNGSSARAATSTDLIGTGAVSLCAWYYANSAQVNSILMGNADFSIFVSTSNRFGLTSDGTNSFLSATNAIALNSWNHICVTRDASGNGIIYINGAYNSNGSTGTPTAGSSFTVGNHPWVNEGWNGLIDDVRLYNRVLSGTEVSAIYTEGGGAATPPPVISGVSISAIATTTATINWTTDQSTDSQVDYGLTTAYGNSSALNSNLTTSHVVALSGLTNGATYHYRVDSRNSSGALTQSGDQTFTTSQQATISGTTVTAASCSEVDVQNAVNEAGDGMTVMVPAGTCLWTQTVTADLSTNPKSLILEGAGIDQTIIQDGVPRTQGGSGPNEQDLFVSTTNGKAFRLTGFTFENSSLVTDKAYVGSVDIEGTGKAIRVDHNKFQNLNSINVEFRGYEYGVLDHNVFNKAGSTVAVTVYENTWPGPQGQAASWGDGSWASPLGLGTGQAIYLEDNVITSGSPEGVTDGYGGARIVVRYNSITNDYITNHGTESAQRMRGTRSMEIYGNVLTSTTQWFTPVYLRSGTGVIFNNTFNGYGNQDVTLINFRDEENTTPWGECDGTSPYDENDPTTYATGSASAGGTTLTDSSKTWTAGQWIGYSLVDETGHWSSMISSNTTNSLSVYPNPAGTNYTVNSLDSYKIMKEDRCLDQPGAGTSDYISGDVTPAPVGWVHQAIDPLYSWGNKYNGVSTNVFGPQMPNIVSGVDFFNNTARPNYTPYACPNPLITSGFTADANPDSSYCQGYVAPPPQTSYTVTASAGSGGSISPSGSISVNSGAGQTFTVTPASGYQVNAVTVDGSPVTLSGATYSLTNVVANHTISASFTATAVTSPATTTNPVTPPSNPPPSNPAPVVSGSGSGGSGGAGATSAPVSALSISGVNVTGSVSSGISVSWITSSAAKGQVLYGLTSIYGSQTAADSSFATTHTQTLSGLAANTLYHFAIQSQDSYGNAAHSGDMTFVIGNNGAVSSVVAPVVPVSNPSRTLILPVSNSASNSDSASASGPSVVNKSLYQGISDPQVVALQDILDEHGFPVAASGNGSVGHETLYFGPATQAALEKFQCAEGIVCSGGPATTGYGMTGPKTRNALAGIAGNAVAAPAAPATANTIKTNTSVPTTTPEPTSLPFTATISNYVFKRSLTVGMSGTDVYELQVFLNTHGFPIAKSGIGSHGYESTYFGIGTQVALEKFQAANHITATGYFGPLTIKAVEAAE